MCDPAIDHTKQGALDMSEAVSRAEMILELALRENPEDTPKPPRKSLRTQAKYLSIEMSEQFGLALRDVRQRAGLTQKDVAKQARVSQTYVSRLELGWQKLTVESMSLLASAVGLNVAAAAHRG
jgi:ribosome-binding protein aMBF1 (putative translation factor)